MERHLLLDIGGSTLGWVSLDIDPGLSGIRMDASRRWSLPDGCAAAIRSEHMIEHLTWSHAEVFVREAFRVLEPAGILRICTPDLEAISRAYLARDPHLLDAHRVDYEAPTWSHLTNNMMRMWGHRFMFDFEAVSYLLGSVGFVEIERCTFNQSRYSLFAGNDVHKYTGELAPVADLILSIDAMKPAARTPTAP